jgi:hypothetical protein
LGRRYRPVILAAAFAPAPLISFASTALMTLETLHRGGRQGFSSALVATGGVLILAWVWGADPSNFALAGGVTLLAGVGLGVLLRWAGTLALAFQGVVVVCAAGAVFAGVFWPDPGSIITPIVAQGVEWLRSTGASEGEIQAVSEGWERLFVGFLTLVIFLQLMAPLLLGSWWAALMNPVPQFGRQFRELRLGRFLGIPATLLMAARLILDGPVIQNLFPLVLFAFWFQGISVVHAWGKVRQWNPAIVAAMYVLLLPPFTGVTILAIASLGLVDNWIDLRAPLRRTN